MNERSLHLSPEGIKKVNLALAAKTMTTERLAIELKLASLYVNKFFRGEAIPTQLFAQICDGLSLNWQELFDKSAPPPATLSIDSTVQEIRQKCHENLTKRCNRIRIPDMTEPRELKEVYTSINIVEEIGQLRERLSFINDRSGILTKIGDRLKRDGNAEDLDRYLSRVAVKSVPALNAIKEYSKLIILGGAGSGKTTFLKYLVLQCLNSNFHGELVPLLIYLKDFAESSKTLPEYILATFLSYGIKDLHHIEQFLNQGNLLILLDGLDEVDQPKQRQVITEVKNLADQFHRNHIFVTCRVCDYRFEQFSEVQIARFNDEQIQTFIRQWFNNRDITKNFMAAIAENPTIREFAENPLLLTFLCLIFESKSSFNYLEIIDKCLGLYLKKWDQERDITTRNLPIELNAWSRLALLGMDAGKYIFKENYLIASLFSPTQSNQELDLKAILKNGILTQRHEDTYAFSYSPFQEYLTAKKIAESSNPQALNYLISRFEQPRWQNVILLTSGMLENADELVIKLHKKANQILEKQQNIQEFLDWINKNSNYLRVSYQPSTLRAFYLDIDLNNFRIQDRNRAIEITRNRTIDRLKERSGDTTGSAIKKPLDEDTSGISVTSLNPDYDLAIALNHHLAIYVANHSILYLAGLLEPQLRRSLQVLKEQLPDPSTEADKFNSWWQSYGMNWSKDCRSLLIQHRKGTQDWSFSATEEALLRRYHDAHVLLVNCLNTSAISLSVKQAVLDTMFLPIWQQP
ncbi:putative NTPase (NACHT family) [Synechococcus sp. PCC 7502]|uniref:NACHT domain-containing protein n=1 Tax=Synechococcus sp. PCC 7502 TaxID=1173263 RepID=UPI00029F9180|nr:NACHT domain-containing protein [Synechococcus sp. PCC 7502]AFY72766.1 putative NTPase (NACHT family) [Synechococcus sp. PCC 7502]